jgi:hypothetical protein
MRGDTSQFNTLALPDISCKLAVEGDFNVVHDFGT